MNRQAVTGILLSGGKSRRMGMDKSLLQWQGKYLAEYAIDALRPLCSRILISSSNGLHQFSGCETVPDEMDLQASIVGIYSCLKRTETDLNLVLTCDMPLITTSVLEYLLSNSQDFDITVPIHGKDNIEPLCGIYHRKLVPEIERCIQLNILGMKDLIQAVTSKKILIGPPSFSNNIFLNINTPEDFLMLQTVGG